MKTLNRFLLDIMLLALASSPLVASVKSEQSTFTLEGVVEAFGGVAPGVEIAISGPSGKKELVSGDDGEFLVDIVPGTYDMSFHLSGFPDVLLPKVQLPHQPVEPMRVFLPYLMLEKGLRVVETGPPDMAPPAIQIAFVPEAGLGKGDILKGNLILQNRGAESIEVPTNRQWIEGDRDPRQLSMAISMGMQELGADYFRYFICQKEKDCTVLNPGEMASIPITLLDRKNRKNPKVVGASGIWKLQTSIKFTLPGDKLQATESIREVFEVVVQ